MNIARPDAADRPEFFGGDPVVGVVLAAGAGRRYGKPKILAAQGEWLANAVSALTVGGCDDVAVTMGAAVVEAPDGAATIRVGMAYGARDAVWIGRAGWAADIVESLEEAEAAVRELAGVSPGPG